MHDGMSMAHTLWMLVMALVIVMPFWRICVKAGYAGWWSLLVLFPLANVVFLYFLAFSEWPSRRRVDSMRG